MHGIPKETACRGKHDNWDGHWQIRLRVLEVQSNSLVSDQLAQGLDVGHAVLDGLARVEHSFVHD